MNSIKQLEYHQCRTCYDSTNDLQLLTNVPESGLDQANAKTYVQLILEVCNINIMDDQPLGQWPQFICLNCSNKLKLAHDFIQHTRKVNQFLKSLADLFNTKSVVDFIQKPELDIPSEIKIEKDEDVEVLSNERVFQYSPTDQAESAMLACDKADNIQEEELSKLLDKWSFGYVLEKFQSEAITVKRMRFLTESDLDYLFRSETIGEKVEFRFRLMEWKKQKRCDNLYMCDSVSPSTKDDSKGRNFKQIECTIPSGSFDLRAILKEHPTGSYVEQTFSENKKLNDVARKILLDAIIGWAIKNKTKLSKNMFERIAAQIEKDFCEVKEIYFRKEGSRTFGRLFDKYYNTVKRLKKTCELSSSNTNISVDALGNESLWNNCGEDAEIRKAQEWLKTFTEPWSEVTNNWRTCFSKRRDDILHAAAGNIFYVLNEWNLFSHSLGYTLIDIDFNILYPTHPQSIAEKWESFKTKIIPILNQKFKDPESLEYLKKINANDIGSEQMIILLLHAILRPSLKRKSSNIVYRATIKDSQLSFLLHCVTVDDVENRLAQLKTSLLQREEKLQPLIIGVGQNISDATFYVYYDKIKYKLPSFLTSVDTCFKMFQVLNLKYPGDSSEVWSFIQRYFYSITLKEDQMSPKILCLINDLNACNNYTFLEQYTNNKILENDNENIKEIIIPSTIEFISNDLIPKEDLNKFHDKNINDIDSTKLDRKATCSQCNKFFSNSWSLSRHKRYVHGPEENKISCPKCIKTFSTIEQLRRHNLGKHKHKKIHGKKVNRKSGYSTAKSKSKTDSASCFTCNDCKKIFYRYEKFSRHRRFVHAPEEEKIACHVCHRKFSRYDSYKRHMKCVHGKEVVLTRKQLVEKKVSRFFCDKCDRSYLQHYRLCKHEKEVHGQ